MSLGAISGGSFSRKEKKGYGCAISIGTTTLLICFLFYILTMKGCFPEYSIGERAGVVWKVSKKGFIWKSWEGELNLGGQSLDASGIMVPNKWPFSIEDPAIATKIEEAARSGKRVALKYRQYGIKPIRLDTDYVVTDVVSDPQ